MANQVLWKAPTPVTAPISGATIGAAAGNLGTQYDNEAAKHRYASFQLTFTHGVAPTPNMTWLIFLIYAQNGTDDEDGTGSTIPSKPPVAAIPVRAVTPAQKVQVVVPILPFKFKPLLWNGTDQSGSSVTLDMEVFDEDIQ